MTILFKLDDKKFGLTYTGEQYRNYSIWNQFQVGDYVEGLEWKDEKKKIIDGDSPVHMS
jgi:hypothetical protein